MPPAIKRVVFDAFGTLFSPRTAVFAQYVEVSRANGLSVDELSVKEGFKKAYKQWAASHPLYGKLGTPPLTPAEWWTSVILDTFIFANVPAADLDLVKSQLATTLVHRFWSREGYALHPDVLPTLSLLVGLSVTPAIATGSDPGTINVLRDLGILDVVSTAGAVMECDIYTTWDLEKEKKNPQFWHTVLERINRRTRRAGGDEIRAAEVLVVGDELTADYDTPRSIGMRSLLLRRPEVLATGEHARASYDDEKHTRDDLEIISSLQEVASWLERQNR